MKKFAIALAAVLAAATMAFAASAKAEVTYDATKADNKITVTYDQATAGSYYALIAVEGVVAEGTTPTITESSIQYIDQVTATGTSISFENFLLKVDFTVSTLYIGGSDLDAPILVGYVYKDGDTISVEFVIDSATDGIGPQFTVTDADGNVVDFESKVDGIGIKLAAGTYNIKVTKRGHLSYTKTNVAVADLSAPLNVTLIPGDVNTDDVINLTDLGLLLEDYGTAGDDLFDDFNGDSSVNLTDLGLLLENYGEVAVVE